MRYALIGLGRIAPNHVRAAISNGLEIVAVCCRDPEELRLAMKRLNLDSSTVRSYTDHRQLLSECSPELVAVATSSGAHAQIALDCIESGAHVLVEKPIAMCLEDADKMIHLAASKGVKLGVCHQNRFNKAILKMRQAVENKSLGQLLYGTIQVRWSRGEEYYRQASWRGTWAEDGGCLMNQCIHGIDLLRWMMGDAVVDVHAITAQQNHPYIEGEDLGLAIVHFENSGYGMIEGTVNCYGDDFEERLCLFGTKGTICVGGLATNWMETWHVQGYADGESICQEYRQEIENVYGRGHDLVYADMLEAIAEDRQPAIDGQAGRRALELVLAIYASAQQKCTITFPLSRGSALAFRSDFSSPNHKD